MLGVRRQKATGIHISTSTVRLVEVGRSGRRLVLHGVDSKRLPQPLKDADFARTRQGLAHVLGDMRRVGGLGRGRVLMAVEHDAFLFKRRPPGDDDGRAQLQWEAEQLLPAPPETYSLDYVDGAGCAFIAAAPRALLRAFEETAHQAGMRRSGCDLVPTALFNLRAAVGETGEGGLDCLLSLGEEGAWVVLAEGEDLLDADYCPWEEGAEREEKVEAATAAVQAAVAGLAASRQDEGTERNGARLWLAGAFGPSWSDALKSRLPYECHVLDPFRYMDCSACEEKELKGGGQFAVAAGLACRALTGD